MLEDDGFGKLGFYSNAIIYFGIGLGCLVSTGIMSKIGEIKSMVLGSFMCVPFMATFLIPAMKKESYHGSDAWIFSNNIVFVCIMLFSFLHGLAEALLFVAQGKYIADCATETNKGFFYSFHWAFYMMSQVIGNYLAAKMLGSLS